MAGVRAQIAEAQAEVAKVAESAGLLVPAGLQEVRLSQLQ